jgi:hypothetical protein
MKTLEDLLRLQSKACSTSVLKNFPWWVWKPLMCDRLWGNFLCDSFGFHENYVCIFLLYLQATIAIWLPLPIVDLEDSWDEQGITIASQITNKSFDSESYWFEGLAYGVDGWRVYRGWWSN